MTKFKVGDKVKCVKVYDTGTVIVGAGWVENRIFTINKITNTDDIAIYWGIPGIFGVYEPFLKRCGKANPNSDIIIKE